jgi:hypothetical protein
MASMLCLSQSKGQLVLLLPNELVDESRIPREVSLRD